MTEWQQANDEFDRALADAVEANRELAATLRERAVKHRATQHVPYIGRDPTPEERIATDGSIVQSLAQGRAALILWRGGDDEGAISMMRSAADMARESGSGLRSLLAEERRMLALYA